MRAVVGTWRERTRAALAAELRPTLALAGPVVLAELGWMAMGVVDTVMVGRLGPEAIGAVGLGNILYFTVIIVGIGLLVGLDTLVSQAFGAGRVDDCHRSLVHGLYLSLALTPILMGVIWLGNRNLDALGIDPEVLAEIRPFLDALNWGTLPLFLFFTVRRYLQGMGLVRPVMVALLTANLVNVLGNWVLVYGRLGAPALGVAGSGWSTGLSRLWMFGLLASYAFWHGRRNRTGLLDTSLRLEPERVRRLLALGVPAATQFLLELLVFAAAAVLAAEFGPIPLAAHEVVLQSASVTFMVPMGISSAASVRVGHAIGRGDPRGAGRAGGTALLLGGGFMTGAAVAFLTLPRTILGVYTTDPAVLDLGSVLLRFAAAFQLFDGLQVVATGALRGAGDTRTPMFCHLVSYWAIGLPIGIALAFPLGLGVRGLWVGLTLGLVCAGIALLTAWVRTARALRPRGVIDETPAAEEPARDLLAL